MVLTRYEGGRRGPVLLASGIGPGARALVDAPGGTSLTEHLVAAGYDVWLVDCRTSDALRAGAPPGGLDDVAREDWPGAVAEVRRVTGAGSVQAVGHCLGSATLMMALALGMSGVRAAVCLHFTLHPSPPDLARADLQALFGTADPGLLDHLELIFRRRLVVDRSGSPAYTGDPGQLRPPLLLVQGARDAVFLPEGSLRTLRWLSSAGDGGDRHERLVLAGYGHHDALTAPGADRDVFPRLTAYLDRFNR